MPLLIVPSHHDSPKSLKETFKQSYPRFTPSNKIFEHRERKWATASWVVIATSDALNKILISPDHNFRWYSYRFDTQSLYTEVKDVDKRSYEECHSDYEDPACQHFWEWYSTWSWSISLVVNNDQYSESMRALLEVIWDLPIVPVLQAYMFDPKIYSKLDIRSDSDKKLTKEMLTVNYPYWFLAYPKRIWPEFYHAHTWKSILRISHHPDKDNSPHYYAFWEDPRLWLKEDDKIDTIREKLEINLLPILQDEIENINKSHKRITKEQTV